MNYQAPVRHVRRLAVCYQGAFDCCARNELELERRLRQQKAIERLGSVALAEQDFHNTWRGVTRTDADKGYRFSFEIPIPP